MTPAPPSRCGAGTGTARHLWLRTGIVVAELRVALLIYQFLDLKVSTTAKELHHAFRCLNR